ncbi:serine/threonine-protein kinase RsbW [Tissierella praeacuta DSM 18095]|uniref:Serine/threonine-protein kinase RsbW n=1 Tax=Tissierella praeacuta DSM 18095 TaxID=1123404 RepID=A0A1M4W464_9FIRM|nr:serine/threonine-protein kinase RsbW [Tissierella praeacuta]SHE75940.1 serine/threonine-protein kinase RsbW [Tissierella praeacuta DSM 18095]SUP00125.1 anti-sigma F factor [Tissierella praeacuta]
MDFKYSGIVCSDLDMIKNFVEDVLKKLNNIIENNDIMFDIRLILNELVINGVLHGNDCITSKCVKLSLEVKENTLTIQVEDEGTGIDYNLESYDPSDLKCCGRGLVIVNGLSDEFYIQKNKVTAIKHIN